MESFTHGNVYAQLGNFFFLLAALFADVFLIRLCLVFGFMGLIAMGFTTSPDEIMLDTVIWSLVIMLFHAAALVRLLLDEAPVKLNTEAEEEVWRFFYRRAGMHRMEFKQCMALAEWCEVDAGKPIFGTEKSAEKHEHLYLIVEGCVSFQRHQAEREVTLRSGQLFDMELCGIFGIKTVAQLHGCRSKARALTKCLVLRWSFDSLSMIAGGMPALANYWRNLFAHNFAEEYLRGQGPLAERERSEQCATLMEDSYGVCENEDWLNGERSRDFLAGLSQSEQAELARPSFGAILRWVRSMIAPLPPPGLRRRTVPTSRVSLEPYKYVNQVQAALELRIHDSNQSLMVPYQIRSQGGPGETHSLSVGKESRSITGSTSVGQCMRR